MEVSRPGHVPNGAIVAGVGPPRRTIAIQPTPIETSIIVTPDLKWTSLVRNWADGDPERCRLCPAGECIVRLGKCHMVVPGVVARDEAELYSSAGVARRVGSLPG